MKLNMDSQRFEKIKLSLLVAVILVATVFAVVWKTRGLLTDDRLGFLADSALKQIAPLKRLVQNRLDEQKNILVNVARGHSLGQVANRASVRSRNLGDYDVIALMENAQSSVGATTTGASQWKASWIDKSETAARESWPEGYDVTLLTSLPYSKVKDGETYWARVSDQKGLPVYAFMISVAIETNGQSNGAAPSAGPSANLPDGTDYSSSGAGRGQRAILVGFTATNPLSDVTEEYIGSTNVVFLVDEKGYIASHVNKAYLGALFSEDQLVHEIVSGKKNAASGRYEDLESRAVLGHFERVDRSNLYAVITTPLAPVDDFLSLYNRTVWAIGGLGCILGLIALWLFGALHTKKIPVLGEGQLSQQIDSAPTEADDAFSSVPLHAVGRTMGHAPPTPTTSSRLSMQNEADEQLNQEFNTGFVSAVKEPLLAVLGHAQLIKAKTSDSEVKGHAESIEREARRATEIATRLEDCTSAIEAPPISEVFNLNEIIEKVLSEKGAQLKSDGIEIKRDLNEVPDLRGSVEQLKMALQNVIDNAREAMRKRPQKKLKFELSFDGRAILLSVVDTGVGMTRDTQTRAFEPFFKTFEAPNHVGMGLTFTQIAIRRLGGSCEIKSSPGEGARFTFRFPVGEMEKRDFESRARTNLADVVGGHFKPDLRSDDDNESDLLLPSDSRAEDAHEEDSGAVQIAASEPNVEFALRRFDLDAELAADERLPETLQETPDATMGAPTENANAADDDSDDHPEAFANVMIGEVQTPSVEMRTKLQSQNPDKKPIEVSTKDQSQDEFKVKIRRPKARSTGV